MSRALNEPGHPWYDAVPDSRDAVAQYFELYAFSGEPEDLEKLVDFPFEHALVTARIATSSTPELERVIERVKEIVAGDPAVRYVGGMAPVLTELGQEVVRGQYLSLALALLAVSTLLMLLFRSPVAGLISAIPLALSALALLGLMGFLGIQLNMATALFSSIMIGVGVDYTIHFLWRYREERRAGAAEGLAVRRTLVTSGRGIVFNALSVIVGFTAFLASGFVPVRFFGLLVIISIAACLVGALVLVPAICIVFRPRFLAPRQTAAGGADRARDPEGSRNRSVQEVHP
jgi:predicted RND superfamily exporter protein